MLQFGRKFMQICDQVVMVSEICPDVEQKYRLFFFTQPRTTQYTHIIFFSLPKTKYNVNVKKKKFKNKIYCFYKYTYIFFV